MKNPSLTKKSLDRLCGHYGTAYLETDPLRFLHHYSDPRDQEVAGFLSSVFAYGQVSQIFKNLEGIFAMFPGRIVEPLLENGISDWRKRCRGFSYRFQKSEDLAFLLWLIRRILLRHGSLENSFRTFYLPARRDQHPVKQALSDWIDYLRGNLNDYPYQNRFRSHQGVHHLLPDPKTGSPCKRLNLYLRWMVRGPDGLDLGIWKSVPTHELILPLDTHTARICRYVGLTSRSAPSWTMAEEITESLRELDPKDPVRYDFSIARLGILALCLRNTEKNECSACELKRICRAIKPGKHSRKST